MNGLFERMIMGAKAAIKDTTAFEVQDENGKKLKGPFRQRDTAEREARLLRLEWWTVAQVQTEDSCLDEGQ